MHLLFLIPLFSVWSHAAGRTTAGHRAASGRTAADHTASASSMGPTPTCFQPQKSTGPRPSAISSVLSSAIPQACDPDQQKSVEYHHHLIHTYHVDSLNFNISDASTATIDNRAVKPRSLCSKAFHNIISACIKPNEGAGFWGGWVVSERSNYSISNFAYPKNGLLSSGSTKGLLKPSKTKLDSSLSKEPTKIATSGVKSHSESSQSPETTHPTTGSHRHRSRLNSKPHTSKESSGSNNKPSQHKTDTLTHHGTRTGIGTTGKPHRTSPRSGGSTRKPHHTGTANDSSAISDSKSGTGTGKHRTDTDSKPKSLMSSQPGHPSKHSPHTSPHVTTGTSTPDPKGPTQRPGQTMITSGPVGIPTKHIDPSSPVATSEGIVIGGLLFSFSKNAKDRLTDITIPATKTAVLDDLEDTEDQLETLFTDMGGSLPPDTGGCGGGGGRRRKRGLFDLAGDVFNTVRCAINSVDSLKSHIDVPEPDIPRIEADLKDIGTLADGVDEDDNKTKDDNDHTKTDDGKSTREPSTKEPTTTEPAKTTDSTSSFSSTARSSSNPCLDGPATTGGIRKRADKGDTCDYKCPSPIPAAPTTGPLAITPAPTDEGDAQQKRGRELAGRIYLVKRAKGSITKINDCALTTPSSDPVTTPNHPGGFAFWQQDKNGQLPASFQTISRYYRTTDGVNQQCAPTVTAVPAQQLTPNQNDQNEIISVDHAYENGWLQGFMEYIIEPPNPQLHQPVLSCPAANAIFFNAYQGAQGCQVNRMAPLYNALASNDNPDFVVMSQWLNGDAKGWIMGPSFDENDGDFFDSAWKVDTGIKQWTGTNQARDSITYKLGHLKNVLLGCLIISSDNVIPMIQKTNNRVYKAFQDLDTQLDAMPNGPYANSDFSGKYRDYMENRATVFNKAPALVSRMIDNIQDDLQAASNLPDVNANERGSFALLLASYKSTYVIGNNGVQWQYHVAFEWDSSNTRRDLKDRSALIRIRNLLSQRDGGACPIKVPPSGTLPPATGFATRTGGGGPAPTKTNGPSKTTAPLKPTSKPQLCKEDSDCDDVKCSSGAAICNLPNSKHKLLRRETPCIALGTCPGMDPPDDDDDDDDTTTIDAQPTKPTPTTSKAPPKPSPTGVCGCKDQNATIVPSSPPKPSTTVPDKPTSTVCTEGKYDNFDACSDKCYMGMCQENAGQPQITCSCN